MLDNERKSEIENILKEKKSISVKQLAEKLYVSEATVRRDLKEMQNMGLLQRSHGGAFLKDTINEVSMYVRMNVNAKEKEKVVSKALEIVPEFNSLFLDGSSTALAFAEKVDLSFKTVVTNNLQTAIKLSERQNIHLILLGGTVQYNTVATTGCWTVKQLDDFSFDLFVSSCQSIIGNEVFERSIDQREIKRAAFNKSKKRILLFDHTKYNVEAVHRSFNIQDFDYVVSDIKPLNEVEGYEKIIY